MICWGEQVIRRVYEVDPLLCRCGERMRVVGFITQPPVILKILHHREPATEMFRARKKTTVKGRAPPGRGKRKKKFPIWYLGSLGEG